eukprot:g19804.t1
MRGLKFSKMDRPVSPPPRPPTTLVWCILQNIFLYLLQHAQISANSNKIKIFMYILSRHNHVCIHSHKYSFTTRQGQNLSERQEKGMVFLMLTVAVKMADHPRSHASTPPRPPPPRHGSHAAGSLAIRAQEDMSTPVEGRSRVSSLAKAFEGHVSDTDSPKKQPRQPPFPPPPPFRPPARPSVRAPPHRQLGGTSSQDWQEKPPDLFPSEDSGRKAREASTGSGQNEEEEEEEYDGEAKRGTKRFGYEEEDEEVDVPPPPPPPPDMANTSDSDEEVPPPPPPPDMAHTSDSDEKEAEAYWGGMPPATPPPTGKWSRFFSSKGPAINYKWQAIQNLKCVVIGDRVADKTRLLYAYTWGAYTPDYTPIFFDNWSGFLTVDGGGINLDLWDTFGAEDPRSRLLSMILPRTDVFIIGFAISNRTSFQNVSNRWYPLLHSRGYVDVPIVLCGTGLELRGDPMEEAKLASEGTILVTSQEGQNMAETIHAFSYVEASVVTREGIKEVIQDAVLAALFKGKTKKSGLPRRLQNLKVEHHFYFSDALNRLQEDKGKSLQEYVADYRLAELHISDRLDVLAAAAIAAGLRKNKNIRKLDFMGAKMGHDAAELILASLQGPDGNSSVTEVDMRRNDLSLDSGQLFLRLLQHNLNIQVISSIVVRTATPTHVQSDAFRTQADRKAELEHATSHKRLKLANRRLGPAEAALLKALLLQKEVVKNASSRQTSIDYWTTLSQTLKALDLSGNVLGNDGAASIAQVFKAHSTLMSVNLSYNEISNFPFSSLLQEPTLVAQKLQEGKVKLLLKGNHIRNPPQQKLETAISVEKYLLKLRNEGSERLTPVRIMVIGHGGVGKTTLVERVFQKKNQLPSDLNRWEPADVKYWTELWGFSQSVQDWLLKQKWSECLNTEALQGKMAKASLTSEEKLQLANTLKELELNAAKAKHYKQALYVSTPGVRVVEKTTLSLEGLGEDLIIGEKSSIDVQLLDFAGQTEYYLAHQAFIGSQLAVYLVASNLCHHPLQHHRNITHHASPFLKLCRSSNASLLSASSPNIASLGSAVPVALHALPQSPSSSSQGETLSPPSPQFIPNQRMSSSFSIPPRAPQTPPPSHALNHLQPPLLLSAQALRPDYSSPPKSSLPNTSSFSGRSPPPRPPPSHNRNGPPRTPPPPRLLSDSSSSHPPTQPSPASRSSGQASPSPFPSRTWRQSLPSGQSTPSMKERLQLDADWPINPDMQPQLLYWLRLLGLVAGTDAALHLMIALTFADKVASSELATERRLSLEAKLNALFPAWFRTSVGSSSMQQVQLARLAMSNSYPTELYQGLTLTTLELSEHAQVPSSYVAAGEACHKEALRLMRGTSYVFGRSRKIPIVDLARCKDIVIAAISSRKMTINNQIVKEALTFLHESAYIFIACNQTQHGTLKAGCALNLDNNDLAAFVVLNPMVSIGQLVASFIADEGHKARIPYHEDAPGVFAWKDILEHTGFFDLGHQLEKKDVQRIMDLLTTLHLCFTERTNGEELYVFPSSLSRIGQSFRQIISAHVNELASGPCSNQTISTRFSVVLRGGRSRSVQAGQSFFPSTIFTLLMSKLKETIIHMSGRAIARHSDFLLYKLERDHSLSEDQVPWSMFLALKQDRRFRWLDVKLWLTGDSPELLQRCHSAQMMCQVAIHTLRSLILSSLTNFNAELRMSGACPRCLFMSACKNRVVNQPLGRKFEATTIPSRARKPERFSLYSATAAGRAFSHLAPPSIITPKKDYKGPWIPSLLWPWQKAANNYHGHLAAQIKQTEEKIQMAESYVATLRREYEAKVQEQQAKVQEQGQGNNHVSFGQRELQDRLAARKKEVDTVQALRRRQQQQEQEGVWSGQVASKAPVDESIIEFQVLIDDLQNLLTKESQKLESLKLKQDMDKKMPAFDEGGCPWYLLSASWERCMVCNLGLSFAHSGGSEDFRNPKQEHLTPGKKEVTTPDVKEQEDIPEKVSLRKLAIGLGPAAILYEQPSAVEKDGKLAAELALVSFSELFADRECSLPLESVMESLRPDSELILGRGQFGVVLKAFWIPTRGTPTSGRNQTGLPVAVKVISPTLKKKTQDALDDFNVEAKLCAQLKYGDRVVTYFGIDNLGPRPCIVMELMQGNSLTKRLAATPTSKEERLRMLCDAAAGLLHLHDQGFIHRDVRADNFLVDGLDHVYIADFGLTRRLQTPQHTHGVEQGGLVPWAWMAPEALIHGVYSRPSDVWMFGLVIWEVLMSAESVDESGHRVDRMVRAHLSSTRAATSSSEARKQLKQNFLSCLGENWRLPLPEEAAEFSDIYCACCALDPRDRPTMQQVLEYLEDMHVKLLESDLASSFSPVSPTNNFDQPIFERPYRLGARDSASLSRSEPAGPGYSLPSQAESEVTKYSAASSIELEAPSKAESDHDYSMASHTAGSVVTEVADLSRPDYSAGNLEGDLAYLSGILWHCSGVRSIMEEKAKVGGKGEKEKQAGDAWDTTNWQEQWEEEGNDPNEEGMWMPGEVKVGRDVYKRVMEATQEYKEIWEKIDKMEQEGLIEKVAGPRKSNEAMRAFERHKVWSDMACLRRDRYTTAKTNRLRQQRQAKAESRAKKDKRGLPEGTGEKVEERPEKKAKKEE